MLRRLLDARVQFPGSSTRAFSYWFYRNLPGSVRAWLRAIVERGEFRIGLRVVRRHCDFSRLIVPRSRVSVMTARFASTNLSPPNESCTASNYLIVNLVRNAAGARLLSDDFSTTG